MKNNNLVNNNEIISSSNIDETNVDSGVKLTVLSEKYNFIPLSFIISIIYMISYVLAKKKIFKMVVHKMIWNTILLFSFLISGLLGIFLVMEINYKIMFSFLPFNMLYWHVEFGIVMFLIAVFHILWHWKYFVGMIKKIF